MLARIRRLARHERPIKFAFGYLLMISGLSRLITFEYFGARLAFVQAHLALYLWTYAKHREEDVQALRELLRPGDTYVDVGANIGSLAAVAANIVGPAGQVFAIEPHPRIFGYLSKNARLNPGMVTACVAIGETSSVAALTDSSADDQNRISQSGEIRVPVVKLDDVIGAKRISLLKVDVEGFELFVFKGASAVFARCDAIYWEASDAHFKGFGYRSRDVEQLLREAGFTTYEAGGGRYDEALDTKGTRNLISKRTQEE